MEAAAGVKEWHKSSNNSRWITGYKTIVTTRLKTKTPNKDVFCGFEKILIFSKLL